jgi:hypothetical protein
MVIGTAFGGTGPSRCRHLAHRREAADGHIFLIGNIYRAVSIHGYAHGVSKPGGWAEAIGEAFEASRASQRSDSSG